MKESLSQKNVEFEFIEILSSISTLKKFLKIRDNNESHKVAHDRGAVGIPTLSVDDTTYIVSGAEDAERLIVELELAG